MAAFAHDGLTRITIEMLDGKTIRLSSPDVAVSIDRVRADPPGPAAGRSTPYVEYVPGPFEFTIIGTLSDKPLNYARQAPSPLHERLARAVLEGDREAALLLADAVQEEWLADPRAQELPVSGDDGIDRAAQPR